MFVTYYLLVPNNTYVKDTTSSSLSNFVVFHTCQTHNEKSFFYLSYFLLFYHWTIADGWALRQKADQSWKADRKNKQFLPMIFDKWMNDVQFDSVITLIQWNSVITNSVVNEHSVITNTFWSQIVHFSTQIDPLIKNKNDRFRVWLTLIHFWNELH